MRDVMQNEPGQPEANELPEPGERRQLPPGWRRSSFGQPPCLVCQQPTVTGVIIDGDGEWYIAVLHWLGVSKAVVRSFFTDNLGLDEGKVFTGSQEHCIRLCSKCAGKRGIVPRDIELGGTVPGIVQPLNMRFEDFDPERTSERTEEIEE